MAPTLQMVHLQAALADLSIAYRQERPPVSDRIFPRVMVRKQADKFFVWNKGDMWRAEARKRAPGALFARMGVRLSSDNYSAEQYAIEYEIPDEVRANQDAAVDVEETATMTVTDQLSLIKDLRFAADFFTSGAGWAAGTVGTAWDNVAGGTPVTAIAGAAQTIRQNLGATNMHRLVGLGGEKIRTALMTSDQVRARLVGYPGVQGMSFIESALASILGLDEVIFDGRTHNTAKEGRAPSYSPLFDNDFLVAAVPNNPGLNTPAAGYTFAWDEDGAGDTYVEMYRDEKQKQDILRGITYFDQKLTGADIGVFFNNAVT